MKRNEFLKSLALGIGGITLASCTDLSESTFGRLTPNSYYKNKQQVLSSVVGVYSRLRECVNYGSAYRLSELGSDEFIIAGRQNGGWYDGGEHLEFTNHNVSPTNSELNGGWNNVFNTVGAANAVIDTLKSIKGSSDLSGLIAETKAMRAMAYFIAMDYWGNVPLATKARLDPNNLPSNTDRAKIFDFVESELKKTAGILPSINDVDRSTYYPRLTKEAIDTMLASLYLNAEVFSGKTRWEDVIGMCDKVINSKAYILEPNFIHNFYGDNNTSKELIISFSIDPQDQAGGNTYLRGAMYPLYKEVANLPFTPANGFNTYTTTLDRYDKNDIRAQYFFKGPQTYKDGSPLLDSSGNQFNLIPIQDPLNAAVNEGYRVLKYIPDGNWVGRDADNDIVWYRYSGVLLMKAEALLRAGKTGALELVNKVRTRSNASKLGNVNLKDIEDERAREFVWEAKRRTDMIRFGSFFTGKWPFKTKDTPKERGIYPIPKQQMIANPKLKQNPGY